MNASMTHARLLPRLVVAVALAAAGGLPARAEIVSTIYTTGSGLGSNDARSVYAVGSTIYAVTSLGGLSIGVVAVPEPSTCAMALAGLACGGYSMFRCRRAR